jgi:hypothetical protein
MGWRLQENYELTNGRDVNRLPWRDRKIIQRAGWVAALVMVFVYVVAGHFRWPRHYWDPSWTAPFAQQPVHRERAGYGDAGCPASRCLSA